MKLRTNKIIAFILCIACVFSCVACSEKACAHNQTTQTVYYKEVDGKVFNASKCNACGQTVAVGEEISVYTIADDANDVVIAQNKTDFYLNPVILIKAGSYETFQITAYTGATLICEEGVTAEKVIVHDGVGNATIDGLNFSAKENSGGVSFSGSSYDVTIKNCNFTGNVRISNYGSGVNENTTIENCVMKDLFYGDSYFTAIIIYRYDGLTVKDCTFDGIGYNVLQVGNKARGGVVTVTGNTFKNVGSRVIYFVNLVGVESCTVSGNYFYDNTDCVLSDGEEDPTGLKKTSGVYICAGGGTPVIIGENFWENIPVRDSKYISTSAEYSPEEQKTISKE